MDMHLKNILNTRPKLLLALAGLVMMTTYLTMYGVLRHRGEMVVVEEGSSQKTYVSVRIGESISIRNEFSHALASKSKLEMEKVIEKSRTRRNLLQVFTPAMYLEGLVREIQVNLTRDVDA